MKKAIAVVATGAALAIGGAALVAVGTGGGTANAGHHDNSVPAGHYDGGRVLAGHMWDD